jgi:hypothetical protein
MKVQVENSGGDDPVLRLWNTSAAGQPTHLNLVPEVAEMGIKSKAEPGVDWSSPSIEQTFAPSCTSLEEKKPARKLTCLRQTLVHTNSNQPTNLAQFDLKTWRT